jgi:hypothetical protein
MRDHLPHVMTAWFLIHFAFLCGLRGFAVKSSRRLHPCAAVCKPLCSRPPSTMVTVKSTLSTLVRLAPVLALFSCAVPKAILVQEAPAAKKEEVAEIPAVPEPMLAGPNDGLRDPSGMLDLPGEGDFKATTPMVPKTTPEAGAVTVRPPTDPPPRPKKPKEGE